MSNQSNSTMSVIVYGRDDKRRPRGAAFDSAQRDEVVKRAKEVRLAVVPADTHPLSQIAETLPKGDMTQPGIGFVPVITAAVLDKLLALVAAPSTASPSAHRIAPDWASIAVGDLVLVPDEPGEGWFEAVVVEKVAEHAFRLEYRDYPDWPDMTFGRNQLGLLPPAA